MRKVRMTHRSSIIQVVNRAQSSGSQAFSKSPEKVPYRHFGIVADVVHVFLYRFEPIFGDHCPVQN